MGQVRQRWAILLPLSLLVLSLSACSSDGTFLPALLADPMASYEAEGIELVSETTQGRGTGFPTGKPQNAEVNRRYSIADQTKVEAILLAAIETATDVGWVFDGPPTDNGFSALSARAAKEFPWGPAQLTLVSGQTVADPEGPPMFLLFIDE